MNHASPMRSGHSFGEMMKDSRSQVWVEGAKKLQFLLQPFPFFFRWSGMSGQTASGCSSSLETISSGANHPSFSTNDLTRSVCVEYATSARLSFARLAVT